MKIAIVTIQNANNYGALFQAFALQEVLSEYAETDIINYSNKYLGRGFELVRFRPTTVNGILVTVKDICLIIPRYQVIKKFKAFIRNNINLTPSYTKQDLENGSAGHYDYYVSGSDQIWNPSCVSKTNEIDPIYFLSFAPKNSNKLSFSSSAGGHEYSPQESNNVKHLLKDFKTIAVREQGVQKTLQTLLGREVFHTLDPTLLLSNEEWLNKVGYECTPNKIKKYILLYTVPKVPLIRDTVNYISKKLGLKIVSIEQGISAGSKVDEQIRNAGPIDFIHLFNNAEFIITDSYHGACFSVNFSKPFAVVSQGSKGSVRVKSFLAAVGLEDRFISNANDLKKLNLDVDFKKPLEQLNIEKHASTSILSGIFTSN